MQFRAVKDGLRAEAVSNGYLDDDNELTPDQEAAMVALGWLPPFDDEGIERAQNYYQELAAPVTFVDVAALAVHTLAYVYGVAYPQDLTYLALDGNKPRGERDLTFPDLGVAVFGSDDEVGGVLTDDPVFDVQEHLLNTLRETDRTFHLGRRRPDHAPVSDPPQYPSGWSAIRPSSASAHRSSPTSPSRSISSANSTTSTPTSPSRPFP